MSEKIQPSICRFCHANCGILVEIEDGRPIRVQGDPDNPAYAGFTCAKGRQLPKQHTHPERLLHSQKRDEDHRYADISSQQAIDEISQRIQALVAEHGPRSVAIYPGTHSGPHPASIPTAVGWMIGLGSRMVFTSSSIDQPGKHVANAIHGRWLAGSYTLRESDVWMLIGNNPIISNSGGLPPSNPSRHLREAKEKGLELIVIDPRRTEVARSADIYLQPRAGEDPTLIAAMLHVVLRKGLYDHSFCMEHVAGFSQLEEAVADYTLEYAAKRAGVRASDLEAAACTFANRSKGCGVAGTGPNMAPHGNLTEYLLLCLNSVCGKWRREGEAIPNPGALLPRATPKAQALPPRPGWGRGETLRSRDLGSSAAGLPTAALADEILYGGDGGVRALICIGSNPVAAWPDQLKTLRAMENLDLLVCLDIKMSATARLADYVIAPTLSLEVPGVSVSSEAIEQTYIAHGYSEPYAQYTPALVEPPANSDVIEEWKFFYRLAQRMGIQLNLYPIRPEAGTLREKRNPIELDMSKEPSSDQMLEYLMNGSRIDLSEIRRHPHGKIYDDATARVEPADPDCPDRLDVGNPDMLEELEGVLEEVPNERLRGEPETTEEEFPFQLISRRLPNVYNSSGRDIDKLTRGRTYNPAFLHPDDLRELDIEAGDLIEIVSRHASILGVAEKAPELRRGVLSMAHCFGDSPDHDNRTREIGSNTGRLINNEVDFDPYSGIPRMSAIPVAIRPA
ncbi:MAG: molybdopterin-dependent oxidoreductase [Myxococcota bacterium]